MIEQKDLEEAWDRIARTPDGHTIFLHLQKRMNAVIVTEVDSTLREDNGERKYAAKLIGLMTKGIQESAPGLATAVFTFAVAGPRAVSRISGAGRRVSLDDTGRPSEPSPEPSTGTGS